VPRRLHEKAVRQKTPVSLLKSVAQSEMKNDIRRSAVFNIFRYGKVEGCSPGKGYRSPERQQGRVEAEGPEIGVFVKGGVAVDLHL
jgi:uncharacterized lipoprotein YajG